MLIHLWTFGLFHHPVLFHTQVEIRFGFHFLFGAHILPLIWFIRTPPSFLFSGHLVLCIDDIESVDLGLGLAGLAELDLSLQPVL